MSQIDRKTLIREYKEAPTPAGVYCIRHLPSGRALVGVSANAPAMLNRLRFQLGAGSCPAKELQRDWKTAGESAFALETLDLLAPKDEPGYDPADDLQVLKELWLEKLRADGITFY
jgi:hypothetical protein